MHQERTGSYRQGKDIDTKEVETLNSMVPLWKKQKSKIKPEDYNEFYKGKFNDWEDPQKVIHYNVEGKCPILPCSSSQARHLTTSIIRTLNQVCSCILTGRVHHG
jgi:hypothetical protein